MKKCLDQLCGRSASVSGRPCESTAKSVTECCTLAQFLESRRDAERQAASIRKDLQSLQHPFRSDLGNAAGTLGRRQ